MTVGLRERKKAETRRALRTAGLELAREHGPTAVTVERICERAGVAPRTFFNYFAGKDDALVGWSGQDLDRIADAVAARPADEDDTAAVVATVVGLLDDAVTDEIWHAQLELIRAHPEIVDRLPGNLQRLERAMIEGLDRRAPADDVAGRAFLAGIAATAVRVAISTWMTDATGPTPGRIAAGLLARVRL